MIATQPALHSNPIKAPMDLSQTESINCPLCQNHKHQLRHRIKGWKIVECLHCQFVFVNPRLKKAELLKLYTSNYFDNKIVGYYHYTENRPLRKKNFHKWVHDALPHLSSKKNVKALDVGCAAGYCLEVFKDLGWQPFGVELDKTLINSLRQSGFTIYDTPLLELTTTEKFDFICLFDVLEHLTDLPQNMTKLLTLLEENGIVVLVTPNYGSLQRRLFGKNWFQFKPIEHINYFDRKSLQRLAVENGFEIIETKNSGQFCDIAFLENRLRKYRFHFFLPFFYFFITLLGLKNKHFYTDTASLYAILRKKDVSAKKATMQQPS